MGKWLHSWPEQPAVKDKASVGVTFVDVLFALVVGLVLEPFADPRLPTGPAVAHLLVAGVLLLTSWIGYHNSHNRPTYLIRFPNLPLLQFLLDIAMVVVYWLTASTAEIAPRSSTPSARPETLLVVAAFTLYVSWDWVAFRIRKADNYAERPLEKAQSSRRWVTRVCLLLALLGLLIAWGVAGVGSSSWTYAIDAYLVVVLVGSRLLKEYVTPPNALPLRTASSSGCP